MPSRRIAEVDHQDDVVHPSEALGDTRDLADRGEFRLQADVDGAHHLLDTSERWLRSSMIGQSYAALVQAADVLEAGFGNAGDAAAQHGARHLWHAATAFGDAEDADAVLGATLHDGARIALQPSEIDRNLRPHPPLPGTGRRTRGTARPRSRNSCP